jgi:tetratricopeptide (TPR) repeat protein
VTIEFRGFAHMLRGEFAEAAECYRAALGARDCLAEQRDVLAFNQARMLAQAGNRQQALEVFAANAAALDARFGHQRLLEEATILRQLGRRVDAERQLDRVVRRGDATAVARLQAGLEYVELGHIDKAEAAFLVAKRDIPIAEYHLALLKLRQGDVDTSFELLARAFEARPAEVRQMLDQQADAWSAVVADTRFRQLTSPAASPGR